MVLGDTVLVLLNRHSRDASSSFYSTAS